VQDVHEKAGLQTGRRKEGGRAMSSLGLKIMGVPFAQQSGRIVQIKGRPALIKTTKARQGQADVRAQVVTQLPDGWEPIDAAISIHVMFKFPPPKGLKKLDRDMLSSGITVPKETRPDLVDNLMKGLCDALTGIVWRDDSLIWKVSSVRIYTSGTPCTEITLTWRDK
jgi:Holliday junction resolvase RusA-like endonuclease